MEVSLKQFLKSFKRYQEFCNFLDENQLWKKVAAELGADAQLVFKIEEKERDWEKSPSRRLLQEVQDTREATVPKFIEILKKLNHATLLHKIDEWIQEDAVASSQTINNRNQNESNDVKRKRTEEDEPLIGMGANTADDWSELEHQEVRQLANRFPPHQRKKILRNFGIPEENTVSPSNIPGKEEYQQGMISYWMRNLHEALPFFEKAATLKYPPAFIRLKIIYENFKTPDKAAKAVEECKNYYSWFIHQREPAWEYHFALYMQHINNDVQHAFHWHQKLANEGLSTAQFSLGLCYQYEKGAPKNLEMAVSWYQKAAQQGLEAAQARLGYCFRDGIGVPVDFQKAVYWLEIAANRGHVGAQCALGVMYEHRGATAEDLKKAAHWYQKAANQGDASAQCNLGLCYRAGKGVEKDPQAAFSWFKKASQQNYDRTMYFYGICLQYGIGVTQNMTEAVMSFQTGADLGHPLSQFKLALCYQEGEGVEKDDTKAAYWLQKVEHGNAHALRDISACLINGIGVPKDLSKAVYWLEKVAQADDPRAMYLYGLSLEQGIGVVQNMTDSISWYKKAAFRDYSPAQFKLGIYYSIGKEVEKNHQTAMFWLKKAAEQNHLKAMYCYGYALQQDNPQEAVTWLQKSAMEGHAGAQYMMFHCYYFGNGVAEDHSKAIEWLQQALDQYHPLSIQFLPIAYVWYLEAAESGCQKAKDDLERLALLASRLGMFFFHQKCYLLTVMCFAIAAAHGRAAAQYNLGECFEFGVGVEVDMDQAAYWYRKAADQNLAAALGVCYEYGIGVAKDLHQAAHWYKIPAEQGTNPRAMYSYAAILQETDAKSASLWYKRAAEEGWEAAATALEKLGIQ